MHRGKAEALQCTSKDSQGTAHKIRGAVKGLKVTEHISATMHNNNNVGHSPDTAEDGNVLDKYKHKQLTCGS